MKIPFVLLTLFCCISCCKNDNNNPDNGGTENSFTFQNGQHPVKSATPKFVVDNTIISLNSFNTDNQIIFLFRKTVYNDFGGTYTYKDVFDPNYDPETNFLRHDPLFGR